MKKRQRRFSGTTSIEASPRELKNRRIAQKAAEEGIVLLKNEGVLPLQEGQKVALLGGGASHMIKGGTGSGDVNEREVVSILQGMEQEGFVITSTGWLNEYEECFRQARCEWRDRILTEAGGATSPAFFDVYSANAFQMPAGRKVTASDIGEAQTAVYVISRVAGEGADRRDVRGDYYLSEEEKEQLRILGEYCSQIVVLLNVGGQIDMKEILEIPQVKAVMLISQPGMEGGTAVGRVLSGKAVPCGKLTDTWAWNYEDFPSSGTFGYQSKDLTREYYTDGIFVGYRYFDTFQAEPLYPFGFGMSYTDFSVSGKELQVQDNQVTVLVSVENTGSSFSGKEVAQIYVSCPQQGLIKEKQRLCGFAKTKELAPGESQYLEITFDVKSLASFEEQESQWILEPGMYYVSAGNSSRNTVLVGALQIQEQTVVEQLGHICPIQEELEEICPCAETLNEYRAELQKKLEENALPVLLWKPQMLKQIRIPKNSLDEMADELIAKLSDEQLAMMTVGELSSNHNIALGAAGIMVPGAAGETSSILDELYDVPGIAVADGPAGLRVMQEYQADEENHKIYTQGFLGALEHGFFVDKLECPGTVTYHQFCTAIPVGTMLAQTWNVPLVEEVGEAIGIEMAELGITLWLAPGMNIHRNPLCGRNFEYYSEDPLISGCMAAAVTRGVQHIPGVGTTIKHFACNNLEDNRVGCDSILTERTLREIYLRGFEIAVKTSQPMSIMTSYNLVNGTHSANNRDMCTVAAREEWDFQGAIMTDWTTTSAIGGSTSWKCIAAGNDLIMPGELGDKENILAALNSGELKREELEGCVHRLLKLIYQSLGYEECDSYGRQFGF